MPTKKKTQKAPSKFFIHVKTESGDDHYIHIPFEVGNIPGNEWPKDEVEQVRILSEYCSEEDCEMGRGPGLARSYLRIVSIKKV